MYGISPTDPGREIDWGKTSGDYGLYRPGYPESFWGRLEGIGAGVAGQRVIDLATGTGGLARRFAERECRVVGLDISHGQVREAARLAAEAGLRARWIVARAEATGLAAASWDLVSASQCWLYFDRPRAIREVKRLLAPGGRLLTCHLCWLPRTDAVARETEALVLRYNPSWTAADYAGEIPDCPKWAEGEFEVASTFWYDEALPFTAESWRGRIRACRGVGAALTASEVASFDADLASLLTRFAPERFTVLHRIDAHLLALASRREA